MTLSPAMLNLVLTVGGAVGGSVATRLMSGIPRAWRGFKKDIEKEALHRQSEILEVEKRARLELRVEHLEEDLHNVAEGMRGRLKLLESIFEERTGKMPKVRDTGETEAADA